MSTYPISDACGLSMSDGHDCTIHARSSFDRRLCPSPSFHGGCQLCGCAGAVTLANLGSRRA